MENKIERLELKELINSIDCITINANELAKIRRMLSNQITLELPSATCKPITFMLLDNYNRLASAINKGNYKLALEGLSGVLETSDKHLVSMNELIILSDLIDRVLDFYY